MGLTSSSVGGVAVSAPLLRAIRDHLAPYPRGETSLTDFDAWFVPAFWELRGEGDPETRALTGEIYLRLVEYSNRDGIESELREKLLAAVEAPVAAR